VSGNSVVGWRHGAVKEGKGELRVVAIVELTHLNTFI